MNINLTAQQIKYLNSQMRTIVKLFPTRVFDVMNFIQALKDSGAKDQPDEDIKTVTVEPQWVKNAYDLMGEIPRKKAGLTWDKEIITSIANQMGAIAATQPNNGITVTQETGTDPEGDPFTYDKTEYTPEADLLKFIQDRQTASHGAEAAMLTDGNSNL